MERTPEKENQTLHSSNNEAKAEEASFSPNLGKETLLTKTTSEKIINKNSEQKERTFNKPKGFRFSADLEIIKNNLIDKNLNLGFPRENQNDNLQNNNANNNTNNTNYNSNSNITNNNNSTNIYNNMSQKSEKNLKSKNSENFINELSQSQKLKGHGENPSMQIKNLAQSVNFQSASSNSISAAAFKLNKSNSLLDKINSAINSQPEDLLQRIFLIKKNRDLSNLIINTREIEKLLLFLFHCKSEESKVHIIAFLKQSFLENPQNAEIFNAQSIEFFDEEKTEWKKLSLFKILFTLISKEAISFEENSDLINLVLTLLEIMAEQANCSKEVFESVFQDLSQLFKKSRNGFVCPLKSGFLGASAPESRKSVSDLIKKNILILKALYSKCFYVEKPHNFFYFNGSDYLRIKEKCFADEKILLKEGFSVLFWVKPDFASAKELGIDNNLINIKCQKNFSINITLKENQILIRNLNNNSNINNSNNNNNLNSSANQAAKDEKICSHDHEFYNYNNRSSNNLQSSNSNNNISCNSDWIFIGITFKKKTSKKAIIKFYINNTSNEYPSEFFDFDNEISEIQLYNRFCGYATSFMLFEGILDEKQMELIKEDKKGSDKFHGFYSENKLTKFLRKINPKHLENSDFEKLESSLSNNNPNSDNYNNSNKKNKNKANLNNNNKNSNSNNPNNYSNSNSNYEILKDLFTKSLKIFFTPTRKSERILYDLTNAYHASLGSYEKLNSSGSNGVRIFHNFQKNIFLLGGINNILPITELMWLSDTYRENFVDFMELISQILFEREKNMQDAIEKNFFQILSVFVEKFDKEIFDARLLQIFKDLLKHFFSSIGKNNLCKIFLDNILLNVKILLKFEIYLQVEVWKTLYQCYVSDPTEINKFMNIKSLSSIIVEYDKTHYVEYCCEEHKNNFVANEETNEFKSKEVMSPTLNEKIKHILMILNLMLMEFDISKNAMDLRNFKNFIKLLILDISPCLQKGIITVLIEFFRKPTEISELILGGLIDSNLIDYLLFNYSISLVDVRCFILALFKVILNYKLSNCSPNKTQITEKIIPFIFENLFPNNLKAFKKDLLKSPVRERGLGIYSNNSSTPKGFAYDNFDLDNKIEMGDAEIKKDLDRKVKDLKNSQFGKFNFNAKLQGLSINANLDEDYLCKKIDFSNADKEKDILDKIEVKEDSDYLVLHFKESEQLIEPKACADLTESNVNTRKQSEYAEKKEQNKNENESETENEEFPNKQNLNNPEDDKNNKEVKNLRIFRSPVFDTKIQHNKLIEINKTEKNNEQNFTGMTDELDTPIENPFDLTKPNVFSESQNRELKLNLEAERNTPFDDFELAKDRNNKKHISVNKFQIEEETHKIEDYVKDYNEDQNNLQNENEKKTGNKKSKNKLQLEEETEEPSTTISNNDSKIEKESAPKKTLSSVNTKKKIGGFSNMQKRNTFNITEHPSMRLDIDAINEKYQFGGDKHKLNISEEETQKNYEEKIKLLAEHCVKFMNGEVNEIKCLDFSSDVFFREKEIEGDARAVDKDNAKAKFPGLYHTENEVNNHLLPNQPNTMRGLQKISFNYPKELTKNNSNINSTINNFEPSAPQIPEEINQEIPTPGLMSMKEVLERNKNKKKKPNLKELKINTTEDKEAAVEPSSRDKKDKQSNTNFESKKHKNFKNFESESCCIEIKEENENEFENEKELNNLIKLTEKDDKNHNKKDAEENNLASPNLNRPKKNIADGLRKDSEGFYDGASSQSFVSKLTFSENSESALSKNIDKEENFIISGASKFKKNNIEFNLNEVNNNNNNNDNVKANDNILPVKETDQKQFELQIETSEDTKNNLNNQNNTNNNNINNNNNETSIENNSQTENLNKNNNNNNQKANEEAELLSLIQNEAFDLENLKASNLDDLSVYFNRENYTKYIHIIFKCCLELMTDRDFNKGLFSIFSDKFNFSNLLSDFESYNISQSNSSLVVKTFKNSAAKKNENSPLIVNPEFLNVLIKITQTGNFSYIYRLLIELQVFIHENEQNSLILANNDEFSSWFLEVIFSCFSMFKSQKNKMRQEEDYINNLNNLNNIKNDFMNNRSKNNSPNDLGAVFQSNNSRFSITDKNRELVFKSENAENTADDLLLDNFLSELNSIFILGKKIHTKIFSDLFPSQKDNPTKKINLLLNWAFNLNNFRSGYNNIKKINTENNHKFNNNINNNEKADDKLTNEFIRIFLEDIFDTIKEELIPSKDSLKEKGSFSGYICSNEKWENFAAYAILAYEYMAFFNAAKNPKFFSLENPEINLIPEKIILSLNLNSLKKYDEQIRKRSFESNFSNSNNFNGSQYETESHGFVIVESNISASENFSPSDTFHTENANKFAENLKSIQLASDSASVTTENTVDNNISNINLNNNNNNNNYKINYYNQNKNENSDNYNKSNLNSTNLNENLIFELNEIKTVAAATEIPAAETMLSEASSQNNRNFNNDLSEKQSISSNHMSREDFNIANEWADYPLFLKIYQFISKIWLETNLFLDKIEKKNQHLKDETLISEFIFNKSKRDLFLENIKFLFYTNNWTNEFLNPNLANKNLNSNSKFANTHNNANLPGNTSNNKRNSYFQSALAKMNNPAPNYKNLNGMLSLHLKMNVCYNNNNNTNNFNSYNYASNSTTTNAKENQSLLNPQNNLIIENNLNREININTNNNLNTNNQLLNSTNFDNKNSANNYPTNNNSSSLNLTATPNAKEISNLNVSAAYSINAKESNQSAISEEKTSSFTAAPSSKEMQNTVYNVFSNNNSLYNIYDMPLIKVINNFLIITINLSKDIKVFNFWLLEYEKFLTFLVFASSNILKDNSEGYAFYQENILDLLIFAVSHLVKLIDELKSRKNNSFSNESYKNNLNVNTNNNNNNNNNNKKDFFKELCEKVMFYSSATENSRTEFLNSLNETLKKVFNYMILIYKKILVSTKKKKNFLSSLISSKKDDLTCCAVFRFFNDIFLDAKEQRIFSDYNIETLINTQFIELATFFKNEILSKNILNNNSNNERINRIFDTNIYTNIIKIRSHLAEKFEPVEMNQLLKPRKSSIKSLIAELKTEKTKVFGINNNNNNNYSENVCYNKDNVNLNINNLALLENKEKEFFSLNTLQEFSESQINKKYDKSFSLLNHKLNLFDNKNNNTNKNSNNSLNSNALANSTNNNLNNNNNNNNSSDKVLISKQTSNKEVFAVIEKAIQSFINDIRELESNELRETKEKKLLYKYVKKKFFSWRGFWADKEVFFKRPELLKYKTLNHYTSTFAKPLLIHILDLEYHLPKFTSFNPKNLLLDNYKNLDYHVCLNIEKILSYNNNSNNLSISFNKNNNFNSSSCGNQKNNNDNSNKDIGKSKKTTFIFDIYKLTSKNIWKSYVEINLLHQKCKINPEGEYFNTVTEKFLQRRNSIKKPVAENLYDCCYVKKCHHIKGIFQVNKNGITFRLNLHKINSNSLNNHINNNDNNDNNDKSRRLTNSENETKNFLEFSKSNSKLNIEVNDIDVHYDEHRKTCVGSYITYHKKDIDKLFRNFPYDEIKYIFKRNYYLRKSGLEIFVANQSYYFNFKSNEERDSALKEILQFIEHKKEFRSDINYKNYYQQINHVNPNANFLNEKDNTIGYENLAATLPNFQLNQIKKLAKIETVSTKLEAWSIWKISNFEMLMWLNLLSNRSYSDISQYPVFPWILKNYSRQLNFAELAKELRDLKVPMGMMAVDEKGKGKERKQNYIDMYKNTKDDWEKGESPLPAYFYGHTYSNPMYVTHYLTRLFPFSQIAVELQGSGFDDPNRMFLNLENSFACSATQKGDVREIIPEFFFMPELFYNLNNINFGERIFSNNEKTTVNDVALPIWAEGQAQKLICKHKETLESQEVSLKISEWFDLIFGFKQRGLAAEEAKNLYLPSAYGIDTCLEDMEKDQRCTLLTMVEIGLVPNQILNKKIPNRLSKDYVRNGKQITESNDLKLAKYTEIMPIKCKGGAYGAKEKRMMVLMKIIDEDQNLMCVFNNNQIYLHRIVSDSVKLVDNFNYQDGLFKVQNKIPELYGDTTQNCPVVLYGNGKYIACGGYWDGGIRVINLESQTKTNVKIYSTVDFPNVCLTIDKDEKYAFAGSTIGILSVFRIYEKDNKWVKQRDLFDHNKDISHIFISNTLNVLATACVDGFVNLYTFPNFHFFRAIKLEQNISADYVFLSNSPLPCVSIFSKANQTFYIYSVNGKKIYSDVIEEQGVLLSPQVFTDISFNDFLIYGTNTGSIRIRKFPEMNVLKKKISKPRKNKPEEVQPIKCVDISEDKKSIFIWSCDNTDINIIFDPSETSEAATENLRYMGLGY